MSKENESKSGVLQRGKSTSALAEAVNPSFELLQKVNTSDTLASQFPDWDLKPPTQLIRRKSSRLL